MTETTIDIPAAMSNLPMHWTSNLQPIIQQLFYEHQTPLRDTMI